MTKPEDYILKRSGTTLEEIYKAAEWEEQRPYMPLPVSLDSGTASPSAQNGPIERPTNQGTVAAQKPNRLH